MIGVWLEVREKTPKVMLHSMLHCNRSASAVGSKDTKSSLGSPGCSPCEHLGATWCILSVFASILPGLIGGSMIIEIIFNINGMGLANYDAVMGRNYPIMFTVLMFSAILVMISMLLADLMYAAVDPRISFTNKKG